MTQFLISKTDILTITIQLITLLEELSGPTPLDSLDQPLACRTCSVNVSCPYPQDYASTLPHILIFFSFLFFLSSTLPSSSEESKEMNQRQTPNNQEPTPVVSHDHTLAKLCRPIMSTDGTASVCVNSRMAVVCVFPDKFPGDAGTLWNTLPHYFLWKKEKVCAREK